jgi:NAD(P)-dependent dehydrogenase (short-subunit alcohol dehydrogenase family)
VQEEFLRKGRRIEIFQCDVSNREQVRQWVRTAHERLGRIDILINNAGIILVGPFETMVEEDYRRAMEINFFGMLNCIFEALPFLRNASQPRIVNITSIGGQIAVPHLLPYLASKFAAVGFSLGLRTELAKNGILVTTVLPGLLRTGSFHQAYFKGARRQELIWFSLNASLPFLSMDAERAARKVIAAARKGTPLITLGMPAKIGRIFYSLFPGIFSKVFSAIDRLLPPAPRGEESQRGPEPGAVYLSSLRGSRTWNTATHLGQTAARKFMEEKAS